MPQWNVWYKAKDDVTFSRRGDYVSADDVAGAIAGADVTVAAGDMAFVVDTSTGIGTLARAKVTEIAFETVGSGAR